MKLRHCLGASIVAVAVIVAASSDSRAQQKNDDESHHGPAIEVNWSGIGSELFSYFFERRPPPLSWTADWTSRGVAAVCVAVTIKQAISAPYQKLHWRMPMDEVYQLLGRSEGALELGTSGNTSWDGGAIRIWYSPGGIARPSGQRIDWFWVRRDYDCVRWFCYSVRKRYHEVKMECDYLQRSKQPPPMQSQ
jgi:hypothetical protein